MTFSEREFRDAMSQFATGVVIVAGNAAGELVGFAAQSFVSLSLSPPLILFCPQKSSSSWPRIRDLGTFSINVLGEHQEQISEAFAVVGEVPDVKWHRVGRQSTPVLDDAIAHIDCVLDSEHDAGDHTIVVGRVNDVHVQKPDAGPLLFFRGSYGHFERDRAVAQE